MTTQFVDGVQISPKEPSTSSESTAEAFYCGFDSTPQLSSNISTELNGQFFNKQKTKAKINTKSIWKAK